MFDTKLESDIHAMLMERPGEAYVSAFGDKLYAVTGLGVLLTWTGDFRNMNVVQINNFIVNNLSAAS
jgi:hypothetical protein